jgi:sec-independent protein translocase protein TatB
MDRTAKELRFPGRPRRPVFCYTLVLRMFGIGFGEMVVIAVLILIAVGPDKLPTMVKTVARTYRQFRRAAQEIRSSTGIDDLLRDEELKELAALRKEKLLAMSAAKPAAAKAAAAKPLGEPAAPDAGESHAPGAEVLAKKPLAPLEEDEVPMGPVAAYAKPGAALVPGADLDGLTYKQRTMEMPLDGVDVAEAQHALSLVAVSDEPVFEKPVFEKPVFEKPAFEKPGLAKLGMPKPAAAKPGGER